MPTASTQVGNPSTPRGDHERATISSRRQELAEMIGRLLARAWLDRQRGSEPHGLSQGNSSNPADS